MKFFKSIKWRLQIWYGLILVAVLAGLSVAAYELERGKMYRQVDGELHRRMNAVVSALHAPQFQRRPPRGLDGFSLRPEDLPDGRLGQDFVPPGRGNFHLLSGDESLFDTADANGFYFILVGRDGKEIARSTNAPTDRQIAAAAGSLDGQNLFLRQPPDAAKDFPQKSGDPNPPAPPTGQHRIVEPSPPQNFGSFREIQTITPPGEIILVGRSIKPELHELRMFGFELFDVSAVILLFGLAGGWWIASRSLRPVSEISSAATKISAGDLSQRINVDETQSELGQLAAVLNSTFARLETAFAQQKQFAADAAHELRTPVSVMLTQTQTALNRERDAASYKQTVEACQRAAQRMRKLIESLLELARFDAGQEVLKRLRFDFSKTIAESVELVQTLAVEKNVKIVSQLEPLEIAGDSERLAQVATNLLTNAIQYNQLDGEVRVRLAAQSGLAVLEIADSGQGIAPEDLPRVFERFYRGDQSRTGSGNAGLGLAICKAIVEAQGGTIGVTSELKKGTVFTVRLPIV